MDFEQDLDLTIKGAPPSLFIFQKLIFIFIHKILKENILIHQKNIFW